MPDLFDKEKNVIHHENLQLYLGFGLKLKKVYCALEFNQSQWLNINLYNTHKRIEGEKMVTMMGKRCTN